MVNYRRNFLPGGTYFFTASLQNRHASTLTDEYKALLAAFRRVRETHPFETLAMVVMPDHVHAIWQLPQGDDNYSQRWRMIKTRFAQQLQRKNLWQRRFWERTVRSEAELQALVDYIHFNPVKHGYVSAAKDWPHSTFMRTVQRGEVPLDWGGLAESPFGVNHVGE